MVSWVFILFAKEFGVACSRYRSWFCNECFVPDATRFPAAFFTDLLPRGRTDDLIATEQTAGPIKNGLSDKETLHKREVRPLLRRERRGGAELKLGYYRIANFLLGMTNLAPRLNEGRRWKPA